jgi:hypothetical protein
MNIKMLKENLKHLKREKPKGRLTPHAVEVSFLIIFITSSNKLRKEEIGETYSMDGTIKTKEKV